MRHERNPLFYPLSRDYERIKMRLLRCELDDDFELITFSTEDLPPYAILSHTWTDGREVTYGELVAGTGKNKAGYEKIRFCAERAAADDLKYFWVDTCCIDKSINQELQTAINSMFRWYQRASKCYVYLSDVQVPEEVVDAQSFRITWEDAFRRSRWFTRGWTLQELLAPSTVEFFSKNGKPLGSKMSLELEIYEITKVPIGALRGQRLSEFSISERFSWAENRKTTYKEDRVYCLLGIFGVFMPLIYGEGEEYASQRLEEEIQRCSRRKKWRDREGLPVPCFFPFPRNESFVVQTLERHSNNVSAVAFSPDGWRLASGSYDRTVRLWDSGSGALVKTLRAHSKNVSAVAFSPDGRLLASASDDRTVRLWDARSGTPMQTLEGHSGAVYAVAFSPDGRLIASASEDRTVRLWDVGSWTLVQTLEGHSTVVCAVAFSPDSRRLASASWDWTARLWDAGSGTLIQTLKDHSNWVNAVAFSPDSRLLASASSDETVRLWDAGSGTLVQTLEGHLGVVCAVAFSPDSRRLASASRDTMVLLWDVGSETPLQTLEGHSNWVSAVAFSPDRRLLASASFDSTVRLWDVGS